MNARRTLTTALLACTVGAGAAACGSSASSVPKTSAPAVSSSPSARSAIAADWTAFFSAKTPAAKRISLLQDGHEFAQAIKAQAGSPLASQASAKVTNVTLVSATQAKVTYSILENGQPALPHQAGVAVYQDGTWKVGAASFCALLTLGNGGTAASLPTACRTTG